MAWSDAKIRTFKVNPKYSGLELNWNFQFGRDVPFAYDVEQVTQFLPVKLDPGLKRNFKFNKAVYQYYFKKGMSGLDISFNKVTEGIAEFKLIVDEKGKAICLIQGNYLHTSNDCFESILQSLEDIQFPGGTRVDYSPCGINYYFKYEYAEPDIPNEKRLRQGQAFFDRKEYMNAAFQWNQLDLSQLETDSAQFYDMAVALYLAEKESGLFDQMYLDAYSHCADEKNKVKRADQLDTVHNAYGFSFNVPPLKSKVSSNSNYIPYQISDVDVMPLFRACKRTKGREEKLRCFNHQITKFVEKELAYPQLAIQHKLEGEVFVTYLIDKSGSIENVEVLFGDHDILNLEAMRLICLLPNATPAMVNGEAVKISYTVPINFKLK